MSEKLQFTAEQVKEIQKYEQTLFEACVTELYRRSEIELKEAEKLACEAINGKQADKEEKSLKSKQHYNAYITLKDSIDIVRAEFRIKFRSNAQWQQL